MAKDLSTAQMHVRQVTLAEMESVAELTQVEYFHPSAGAETTGHGVRLRLMRCGETERMMQKFRWMILAALVLACGTPASAEICPVRPEFLDFGMPLVKTRAAIMQKKAIEIVTLGSSSTAGYGATSSRMSYPAELLRELTHNLPTVHTIVYNRGINGQDVRAMLQRLEHDVFKETPDLVIWQLGTNAALRAQNVDEFRRLLADGVDRLRVQGIEVILMNLQYAPAVNVLPNEEDYLRAIDEVAREKRVPVFPRYAIMKYWYEQARLPYAQFIIYDGLHMNDYGYQCIGSLLARFIEKAIAR
jgi:lysophospholipase L1-like esterase